MTEAQKYDVLPLDNSTLSRWNTPRPSLTGGRTRFEYFGELGGVPASAAPNILNRAYTITAEIEVPRGGAEGMIVTEGGRFGGYGLFLTTGELGIGRSRPVFLYNLLNLRRTVWKGPELDPGKHTVVFDYTPSEPGLGKGGTSILSVDGTEVDRKTMEHSTPVTFPEDETFDVGLDTPTPVALLKHRYDVPFRFTSALDKLTIEVMGAEGPPRLRLLSYSAVMTLYLGYLGIIGSQGGPILWPAAALHALLTLALGTETDPENAPRNPKSDRPVP